MNVETWSGASICDAEKIGVRTPHSRASRILDKTVTVGSLSVLMFTVLAFGAVEPWSVLLFELMVIALLLLWGIKMTADRMVRIVIPSAAFPIFALFLLGLAQSVAVTDGAGRRMSLSLDVEATRHAVTILFFLAAYFIVAANFAATRVRLIALANALTLFGTCLAAFALIQHFSWDGRFYWLRTTSHSVFGPFVNRNHFAGYMAMLAPMPLALILTVVRGHARLLYGFAAALMGTASIVSGSRSGLAALFAAILFIAAFNKQQRQPARSFVRLRKSGLIAVVVLAMIAGVVWVGAAPMVERVGQAVDSLLLSGNPDEGRATIWHGTLLMIRDYPILGTGLGAFRTAYPKYAPSLFGLDYAHNDYLQIVADAGAVGGIIALWFIVAISLAIRLGIRSRDPLFAGLSLAAGAGIVAVLVQSLADTDLQIPSNALLFLVLCAMASRIGLQESSDLKPATPRMPGMPKMEERW